MITDPAKSMTSQFWFARRLKDHGVTVYFPGTQGIESRWEIIRMAIVNSDFADKNIPKTLDTYRTAYERATGTSLVKQEQAA